MVKQAAAASNPAARKLRRLAAKVVMRAVAALNLGVRRPRRLAERAGLQVRMMNHDMELEGSRLLS